MSRPPRPLTPGQRLQLVGQIGQALTAAVPPGWRQLRTEYRAAGRHIEADVIVTGSDGVARPAPPPPPVVQLLGSLRAGMYQPGRGTWLGAVVVLDAVNPPRAEFTIDEEPRWRRLPPPVGFADELRFFPRAEEHIPGWLRRRAGLSPGSSALSGEGELRTPRVYDGLSESGRPVVNREALRPDERDRVLAYLETAPVVLAARTYDADAFDPGREPLVPLNFRTDGAWVWPGAVGYYLREHEVAPDPDLLAHLRSRQFVLPEVDESTRDRAITAITEGALR
ncbi:MAG TPA: ferredoxin [Amycolatopsis sp.]|uniref:ferredoxin n=1 Tax=Amycolatopsis sp. TaxID=37632 RepID=UPI002B4A79AD|nr:ferredoxin [Amycolatopsis sp.]HKS45003.1 ferredoxin [Amycolatopsis sp.]